mgnify:CR=1 FL=1
MFRSAINFQVSVIGVILAQAEIQGLAGTQDPVGTEQARLQ